MKRVLKFGDDPSAEEIGRRADYDGDQHAGKGQGYGCREPHPALERLRPKLQGDRDQHRAHHDQNEIGEIPDQNRNQRHRNDGGGRLDPFDKQARHRVRLGGGRLSCVRCSPTPTTALGSNEIELAERQGYVARRRPFSPRPRSPPPHRLARRNHLAPRRRSVRRLRYGDRSRRVPPRR